jgi:phospholipid/cholesterol/gamma-HCH transport system substrate-binding protein
MSENTSEVLVGGAVLAAAVGFLFYAGQGGGLFDDPAAYELKASFRSVEGVTVGTDVRLAGVKVGTVTSLSLNPQTFFADATISVAQDVILPEDSAILISSEGLLGGAYVELVPGGALENLAPGSEILDTQGAISVVSLMMKFVGDGVSDSIGEDADGVPAP